MPKVSVIIPVYNSERYIKQAMIGLMEQTLDSIEFIIIDDGSKDNSLSIAQSVIDKYPKRKKQVTIISRENKGVSYTRAEGLRLAAGDFVIHHDSDDWAEPNWLLSMYTKALEDKADIVLCDYNILSHNKKKKVTQKTSSIGKECAKKLLTNDISNANWNKLVNLEFIRKLGLNYVNGVDMGEDFIFSLKVFFNASQVSHITDPLYNYNKMNDEALTKKFSSKSFEDIQKTVTIAESFLEENNAKDEFKDYIDHLKLSVRSSFLYNSDNISDKELGINLYPETNATLFKEKRHWLLKINVILFHLKLKFAIKYFDFIRKNIFRFI